MNGFSPGDRVLFRDGDRFGVAKVDLVRERHLTAFPFDTLNRRWSRRNRRIAASFVIGKLPAQEHADRIALRIERLRHQHEAERQQAKRQFEERIRSLVNTGTATETPRP